MFHQIRSTLLAAAALSIALTACSGRDESSGLLATPVSSALGVITNATVNIYAADGKTLLARGQTGSGGAIAVPVIGYNGPAVIEVVGGADAQYFDEAAGRFLPFPAGQRMRAVAPSLGRGVAVTPLTEMAYQLAASKNQFPITASQAQAANESLRAALAPGLSNLLSAPTPVGPGAGAGSLGNDEAGRYALILAALAELAKGDASPALTVLNALVADGADGTLDGKNNGVAITVPYSNFVSDMSAALQTMANTYGTAGLRSNAGAQAPRSTSVDGSQNTGGGGGNGGTDNSGGDNGSKVDATINTALVGSYTLVMHGAEAGSPYAEGEEVTAVVGANNTLKINDSAELSNPFYRVFGTPNTAEIIWLDQANQIEYALTDNKEGHFNEINVGDAKNPGQSGIPRFYGQLRLETTEGTGPSGPPPELLAIAGEYAMTTVQYTSYWRDRGFRIRAGATMQIDGTTGVIKIGDSVTLSPDDAGYVFIDHSKGSAIARGYSVSTTVAENQNLEVFIYLRDDAVVAFDLTAQTSANSFSTLVAEFRPVSTEIQTVFGELLEKQSVTLTVVADDESYSSGYGPLCNEFVLSFQNGSSVSSSFNDVPFNLRATDNDANSAPVYVGSIYRGKDSFLTTEDAVRKLTLRTDRLELGAEGLIDIVGLFGDKSGDRASNDSTKIQAAGCTK